MRTLPLLLVLVAAPALAQQEERVPGPGWSGAMIYFLAGGQRLDLGGVNRELRRGDIPTTPQTFLALGGGVLGRAGRFVFGFEGLDLGTRSETTRALVTEVEGGYWAGQLGWVIVDAPWLRVYPLLSAGSGSVEISIASRDARSFDEVVENPLRGARLSGGGWLARGALAADLTFADEDPEQPGSVAGFLVGLRLGWAAPLSTSWRLFGREELTGAPGGGIAGPFMHLVVGFFAFDPTWVSPPTDEPGRGERGFARATSRPCTPCW